MSLESIIKAIKEILFEEGNSAAQKLFAIQLVVLGCEKSLKEQSDKYSR